MEATTVKRLIFESIVDHHERWNYLPCRSEILRLFSGLCEDVNLHLEQLVREGVLKLGEDGEQITIMPLWSAVKPIKVPNNFRPHRDAGDREPPLGTIALDLRAIGVSMDGEMLAQVILDDSMIDAGLRRQDIAIYRAGSPARGEIVLAEVSGKLVFRRYLVIKDIPHLLAENCSRPDLSAAFGVHMHGVLCCVISPRFNSAVGSAAQEARKVNYTHVVTPAHKQTRWPAPPSGIGLNDRVGPSYTTSQWHRTSEDPPEQAYGYAQSQASAEFAKRKQKNEVATSARKVNPKCVRASDVQPVNNPPAETSKNKRTQRVRTRLRV